MNLREAAQQALEALELGYDSAKAEADQFHAAMAGYKPHRHAAMDADVQKIAQAITDLRAALAQQAEPVAWTDADADAARLAMELECLLTDKDVPTSTVSRWWESAHEALDLHRQRLAAAPPATQQTEPVAYIHRQGNHWEVSERLLCDDEKERGWTEEPLYTAPPSCPHIVSTKEGTHHCALSVRPDLSHLARYGIPEPGNGNPSF